MSTLLLAGVFRRCGCGKYMRSLHSNCERAASTIKHYNDFRPQFAPCTQEILRSALSPSPSPQNTESSSRYIRHATLLPTQIADSARAPSAKPRDNLSCLRRLHQTRSTFIAPNMRHEAQHHTQYNRRHCRIGENLTVVRRQRRRKSVQTTV